ncbi:MAG: DUF2155 domain-containing protein [Paracoccaceae bacterium]
MRWLVLVAVLAVPAYAQEMASAPGGTVRVLDRLSGALLDVDLSRGEAQTNGRLTVQLDECRYPVDDPASEAEAHLTIYDSAVTDPVFNGWMVASAPALSALDHPRYDVWVLHCDTPGA